MERRGGLGKGLGALIPSDVAPSSAAGLASRPGIEEVAINQIDPNPYQPRNRFDEESLAGSPPRSASWACCSRSWSAR